MRRPLFDLDVALKLACLAGLPVLPHRDGIRNLNRKGTLCRISSLCTGVFPCRYPRSCAVLEASLRVGDRTRSPD